MKKNESSPFDNGEQHVKRVGDGFSAATAQLADTPAIEDVPVETKECPAQGGRGLCRADRP